jgi:2-oxo-4-hydroxy-4-carboxy--5-ureidoimidazoline (OHCU) decarboxylase
VKSINEIFEQVIDADTEVTAQEPLGEFQPNIFTTARWTNESVAKVTSMANAIEHLVQFAPTDERRVLARKLRLIRELAEIAGYIGQDEHNTNDCRIEACALASDDPEIRNEARP